MIGEQDAVFAEALRTAVKRRGLSLTRIRARLSERGIYVGVSTLSTWQSGTRVPREGSDEIVAALEDILDLPLGSLRSRLTPAREEVLRPRRPYRTAVNAANLARLVAEVDPDSRGSTRTLGVVEELLLGPDGNVVRKNVIQSVRAVRAADRIIMVHTSEQPADIDMVSITATAGCRTGRTVRDTSDGSLVAELLLDRRLAPGSTATVHYTVSDTSGSKAVEYFRFQEWSHTFYSLEVQFHRDLLPVCVTGFSRNRVDATEEVAQEIQLTPDLRAHTVVTRTEPSIVGIRWEWP